jgi:hybrid cluster-associated redox disulfide protein
MRFMAISKELGIREVVSKYPDTIAVFRRYGMGCFGCAAASYENIEEGARAHEIDIDLLINDLNKVVQDNSN